MMGFNVLKQIAFRLLTKTESLDDGTVAIDIAVVQVIEQCATLSYKLCQRTCCSIIFTVLLYVFRQMSNTVWNNAIWLSAEPVSELDFPYLLKISSFFALSKYIAVILKI